MLSVTLYCTYCFSFLLSTLMLHPRPLEAVGFHSELPLLVLWRMHLLGQYLYSRLNWPSGRVFHARKPACTMSSSFFISSLEFPRQASGISWSVSCEESQEAKRRGRYDFQPGWPLWHVPLPRHTHTPHTHIYTLTQAVSGSSRRNWQFYPLSSFPKEYAKSPPNTTVF